MSFTIDYGFTRPVSTKNLALTDWDYSDFTNPIITGTANSRVITYTNKTGASDRHLIVEITRRKVADAYKGTGIHPAFQSPVHTGISLVIRNLYTVQALDSDTNGKVYLPIADTQTVTWVDHPAIDASVVLQVIKDSCGLYFPTDSVTANQIADFIAGGAGFLDETSEG